MSHREDYFGPDGRPQVCARQCSTCIGLPGNPMDLKPGPVWQMVRRAVNSCGAIICHQTLSYGDHPEQGGAVCRWFYDTYGHLSGGVRVQARIGDGFREIELPGGEDDPSQSVANRQEREGS
jgi:hypothetical protein